MGGFSIPNLIMGLIGFIGGIWMTKEAYYLNHHVLFLGWVEEKWGPGMGTTFYRWAGLCITIFSFFVILGYIDLYSAAFGSDPIGTGSQTSPQTQQAVPNSGGTTRIAP